MSEELRPAKPPYSIHPDHTWVVVDADGIAVLSCNKATPTCCLWKDDPLSYSLRCPKCGAAWIKTDFATPQQCGIERKA